MACITCIQCSCLCTADRHLHNHSPILLSCPALLSCMPTYRLLLSPMLTASQAWLEFEHMLTIRLSMLAEGCCSNLNASACFVLLARNSLQCIPIPQLDCQLSVLVTTVTAAVCAEWLKKRQGAKSLAQCSNHITSLMACKLGPA